MGFDNIINLKAKVFTYLLKLTYNKGGNALC